MRGGGGFERRAARQRVYSIVAFLSVSLIGLVIIVLLLYAGKQRVHNKLYRDPVRTSVKVFAEKETLYRFKHDSYATLEQLIREGYVSDEFAAGPVEGYRYRVTEVGPAHFVATAEPEGPPPAPEASRDPGKGPPPPEAPRRFYRVDETHTVRAEDTHPAGPASPVVWDPRDESPR